jgi:hypothetical protein
MLRYAELGQNPVSVTVRDKTGATFTVRAERLRRGRVKLTCECPGPLSAGWCQHCLAVFSDREIFESDKHRQAFEHIVDGTYIENVANKLTKALDAFAAAYRQMKFDRPAELDPSQLNSFAKRAYQAGETAGHLAQVLEQFIDELRLRPPTFGADPNDHGLFVAGQFDAEDVSADSLSNTGTQNLTLHEQSDYVEPPNSPKLTTVSDLTKASLSEHEDSALEMVRKALGKELESHPLSEAVAPEQAGRSGQRLI